ncbi:MAG: amidohydrolase family protein, partial [Lachnospiraceae bacterium]|nr:amidohydrolase family protein [Lachnospiraceae bacterium]
ACETKVEVDNCKKKHGCTPIEYLEKIGLLTNKTILAHCVHLERAQREVLLRE